MNPLDRPLIEACQNGDLHTTQALLQQGANPNSRTDQRQYPTPLLIASENGHTPIIQLLVQYGANPHATDHEERNALHYAVGKSRHKTVQYLITQLKLDPNTQERWGTTPFMLAAQNGDIDMLQLLIQLGADPHIIDKAEKNALHYATLSKQYQAVQYLITELQFDIDSKDAWGRTPFLIASKESDIPMLHTLAQLGANPNTTDLWGLNALHHAVESPSCDAVESLRYDVVEYLITQLQFDPNNKDGWGRTPFLIASEKGDIPMLHTLVKLGANPHATDYEDRNAFHRAVEKQQYDIAQYLITQFQLDPNIKDQWGRTPFVIAVQKGDINMLKSLIQLGADPTTTDPKGQTALHYALKYKNHDIAQYLLTQLQLDPNQQDHKGITPFMLAVKECDIDMIRLLVRLGADPYATDHQGRNALHYAAKYGGSQTVLRLIAHHHLDPNQQDHDGNTPLHIALQKDHVYTAKILIQLGANLHILNYRGETPAVIARQHRIRLSKPQPSAITL